ncbi:MAG: hypothetical protein ACTSRZ_10320 [Promethearchaeota archaeon]
MTNRYNFKIIVCGNEGCGKTKFLSNLYAFSNRYKSTVGINIGLCNFDNIIDDTDVHLIIWDLSNEKRFYELHRTFILGCSGVLLFFSENNPDSFYNLERWFDLFMQNPFSTPYFLINIKNYNGNTIKFENEKVISTSFKADIEEFIGKYGIARYFKWELNDESKKNEILKTMAIDILNNIPLKYDKEKEKYVDILFETFKYCPICGSENHRSYIRKFYYSKNPLIVPLKEELLDLISSEYYLKYLKRKHIKLGIPCCKCYNRLFS